MNFKKYLPTLVAGFGAAVFSTVPGIKNFSCNLIVPASSAISILIDKKLNPNVVKYKSSKGVGFGFMTGLFATLFITLFETIQTFFTKSNNLVEKFPQIQIDIKQLDIPKEFDFIIFYSQKAVNEIESTGFSITYVIILLIILFIINSIFGMIGGALGVSLANRKSNEENS